MNTQHQTMHLRLLNPSSKHQLTLRVERGHGMFFKGRLANWKSLKLIPVLLGFALLPLAARSDLISMDDPKFGPGTVTLDTRTGLQWLDLPLSLGMSYNYASSQMVPGGLFANYTHATDEQVESLFVSAGIPDFGKGGISSVANIAPATNLLSFIGATLQFNGYPAALGFTSSMTENPPFRDYEVLYCTLVDGVPEFEAGVQGASLDSYSNPAYANYLIAVPEPSCACLLGGGIVLMAVFRRARRICENPATNIHKSLNVQGPK